jgi:hypothetical protein
MTPGRLVRFPGTRDPPGIVAHGMIGDVGTMAGRRGRKVALAVTIGAVALAVAACGGAGDGDAADESSGGGSVTDQDGGDTGVAAPVAGEVEEAGAADALTAGAPVAEGRDIVRTGTMTVTVGDAPGAADDVRRLAADRGGFVADESVRVEDDEVDLTLRVPADAFDDLRDQVADLGDVAAQDSQAQDVTAQVVDLDSRITSLRASVERLRGLLGQAGDVGQLAAVEGELTTRESELEALLGQQRVLQDQVALATLTVHLTQERRPTLADDAPGFTDGLRAGWVGLVEGGRVVLAAVGFAVPFAVPALLVLAAVRWWRRRRTPTVPPVAPAESVP